MKTVLVVDDENDIVQLIRYNLEREGFRVESAATGDGALLKATEVRPDVILLDIMLPGMDGLSATKIIKADPELKEIPIFALTGFAMESDKAKATDIGLAGYIVKPFSVKSLLETLANHFTGSQVPH